jgi:hypothetical protein
MLSIYFRRYINLFLTVVCYHGYDKHLRIFIGQKVTKL